VKLQPVLIAFLGKYSHVVACLATPVDDTQSQAIPGGLIFPNQDVDVEW
jgi:hypothetical protein